MAYVVRRLDELGIRATFEHVVVAAFKLFPAVFSLEGYSQYPDAARVNRTLLHGGPKYRDYLTGRAVTGYALSTRGQTAAQETLEMISADGDVARRKGRAKAARSFSERMEQEVRSSDAFRAWQSQGAIQSEDFYLFLHLFPGSPKTAVQDNFAIIRDHLKDSSDPEISIFLKAVADQFKKELT